MRALVFKGAVLFGLFLTSLYSYILFHSLAEIFSIAIGCSIFTLAWNSRRRLDNDYLLFLGIAYLFVSGLDLIHTRAGRVMVTVSLGVAILDDKHLSPETLLDRADQALYVAKKNGRNQAWSQFGACSDV
jgi:GGDEF domain-containing protein